MKIGELAKRTGCSVQTIRYYEKEGLLRRPERTEGNFRVYNDGALKDLEFVKHCRSLSIPLSDIKQLLRLKQHPDESCLSINSLIEEQLTLVNLRIAELNMLKNTLQEMALSCDTNQNVESCGILKSLAN